MIKITLARAQVEQDRVYRERAEGQKHKLTEVCKARRLVYHSTVSSREINKKKRSSPRCIYIHIYIYTYSYIQILQERASVLNV